MHWWSDQRSCRLTGNFLCKARRCREARWVLSNCIAEDMMIEHSPAKLSEPCQSQYKLCSKCCSVACVGGGGAGEKIRVTAPVSQNGGLHQQGSMWKGPPPPLKHTRPGVLSYHFTIVYRFPMFSIGKFKATVCVPMLLSHVCGNSTLFYGLAQHLHPQQKRPLELPLVQWMSTILKRANGLQIINSSPTCSTLWFDVPFFFFFLTIIIILVVNLNYDYSNRPVSQGKLLQGHRCRARCCTAICCQYFQMIYATLIF